MALWTGKRRLKSLGEAIQRINSGKKIISPADDPHGITEADKIQTNRGRILSANKAIDTGLSYVQTAQGLLTELQGTLDRMSEIATQVNSSPLGASERGNYNYEFNQLASQLLDVLGSDNAERFDIVNGFQSGDSFTITINGKDYSHTVEDSDNKKPSEDLSWTTFSLTLRQLKEYVFMKVLMIVL